VRGKTDADWVRSGLGKKSFQLSSLLIVYTTGNPGFAEGLKLSAKDIKHSATSLPRVALGKGLTGNFFSATILCRAPELQALGTAVADSLQ
jgi:hypothetical protein